jgi:hypothetical protein
MCQHPIDLHDTIAARYCKATASSALSRGCVCSVKTTQPIAVPVKV